jgi:hypothetical protein
MMAYDAYRRFVMSPQKYFRQISCYAKKTDQ